MDDDDVQETGVVSDSGAQPTGTSSATAAPATTTTPAASGETPPAQPPRPVTEQQKSEAMLKEAFPTIDAGVIKAVLIASGGRIDPAFNALLAMSDPDAVQNEPAEESAPPPQPPRPTGARAQMSQLEADELYARQLAEHYDNVNAYEGRTANRGPGGRPQGQAGLRPAEDYEREHSFIDDELPVIRDNLRKGFMETQTKVTSWFNEMKKRIDGEYDSEEDESQPSKNRPHHLHPHQQPPRRSGEGSRRSNDYDRYDADPQVLSDDFAGIRLNPDGSKSCHLPLGLIGALSLPTDELIAAAGQPGAQGVYRPPPKSASPRPDNRRVAFKEGVEDIDVYNASPKLPPKDNVPSPAAGKPSKWQPMSAVDPNPISEHDPFSLGDSEDEKEPSKTGPKETKMDDSERLKKATADAMADSLMDDPAKKAEAAKKA